MAPNRQPLITHPRSPTTPPPPTTVDFQAEDASVYNGQVASNHGGFTGAGFVDYDSKSGGSIEWTVTAAAGGGTDVVFRYTNGSIEARPMAISVNGSLPEYTVFPVTNGWLDWQNLTIHTDLPSGTSRIRATAIRETGGPNIDKITLVSPA